MQQKKGNLRKENSKSVSGKILRESSIYYLHEDEYIVKHFELDGDAPKQFIKAYFYEENSTVRKAKPKSWHSYIAKTAEKWYPHESIIEFMINRIGIVLGVNMNEVKIVKANGQIRFLSKYFLKANEKLIHGAEICGEHLGDMLLAVQIANHKNSARELFTFEFIRDAIRNVFPISFENILLELVKMACFDSLTGNNDRHFYNWGVIDTIKKTSKPPIFAPLYDSARGLLWNVSDANCKHFLSEHLAGRKKVVSYIEEASPRISIENNTQANHFELIDFLKRYNKDYEKVVMELVSLENQIKVLEMLKKEFYPFFIQERCRLITIIIETRFKRIRGY
jgi:hypothetical protein